MAQPNVIERSVYGGMPQTLNAVMAECPQSGVTVFTGMVLRGAAESETNPITALCPDCGQFHRWNSQHFRLMSVRPLSRTEIAGPSAERSVV